MKKEIKVISLSLAQKISKVAKEKGIELPESERVWCEDRKNKNQFGLIKYPIEKLVREAYRAYDASELGEMLPKKIVKLGMKYRKTTFSLMIAYEKNRGWKISYVHNVFPSKINCQRDFVETEARGKMFVYLIKNNLL